MTMLTATILLNRFLNGQLLSATCNNATVGVKLSINNSELFLFSLYCHPSIQNLNDRLAAFASTLSTPVVKRAIFCLDSNAKNPFWNSATLDRRKSSRRIFWEHWGHCSECAFKKIETRPLKLFIHRCNCLRRSRNTIWLEISGYSIAFRSPFHIVHYIYAYSVKSRKTTDTTQTISKYRFLFCWKIPITSHQCCKRLSIAMPEQ